eukprot:4821939-Amphidinium_carterae.1
MLACTENGNVFAWGCGLTHQLGNRPRRVEQPDDRHEEPGDEVTPYQISSRQLDGRFVMLADGGAQHSAELGWTGEYAPMMCPTHALVDGRSGEQAQCSNPDQAEEVAFAECAT